MLLQTSNNHIKVKTKLHNSHPCELPEDQLNRTSITKYIKRHVKTGWRYEDIKQAVPTPTCHCQDSGGIF